ncbi:MAG: alpha/beta hydrolase-fold protein, partial [Planctomycetota bacterium]|nr:alpha/beta hydrolase-fold protein [Planctomycetota bacterium]
MSSPRGQVERLRYTSQALTDNPLGDPIERDVCVCLPPYYAASGERYPVLWVLTGFTGRGRMALNDSPWAPGLDQRMDRLVAEGAPPAILVLPDCFTRYGGSQYVNSSATGRYEDYVIEELVPLIDQ